MGDTKPVAATCPQCQCHEAECLEGLSSRSSVDYVRCLDCGHVWTLARAPIEEPCDLPPAAIKE